MINNVIRKSVVDIIYESISKHELLPTVRPKELEKKKEETVITHTVV
jgi:hypothetical protein